MNLVWELLRDISAGNCCHGDRDNIGITALRSQQKLNKSLLGVEWEIRHKKSVCRIMKRAFKESYRKQ